MELVWLEEGEERSIDIGPERPSVMLGRLADCDIRVTRSSVSRRHALFTWSPSGVTVTDQDSTAGTWINNERITRSRVQVGTIINCGGVQVLLDEGQPQQKAAPARPPARPEDDFEMPARRRSAPAEDDFEMPARRRSTPAEDDFEMPARRRSTPAEDDFEMPARRRSTPAEDDFEMPARRRSTPAEDDFDSFFDSPSKPPVRGDSTRAADFDAPSPRPRRSAPADDIHAFFSSSDPLADDFDAPPPAASAPVASKRSAREDDDDLFRMDSPRRGARSVDEPVNRRASTYDDEDDFKPSNDRRGKPAEVAAPPPAPVVPLDPRANLACFLLYTADDGSEAEIRIERDREPILIGRREGAHLKVRNASVSGKHATVGWRDGEVEVRDVGSSNGTYVNGERIRRALLQDGDILKCGRFELRVGFVELKDIAQAEYDEWGEDWSDDELDPGQARYYVIYRDNRNQLTGVILGGRDKQLAVGSRGCEINIEGRSVEAEHCEIEWDEGVLIVKDLNSETGTFVNDEAVEGDETLRNGDLIVVGRAVLRVVRGTSEDLKPPAPERRSEEAEIWARHLDLLDDDFELLFIDGEIDDDGGRHELSIWGNGVCQIQLHTRTGVDTYNGAIDRDLRRILFEGLLKSGFPDVKTQQVRLGETPARLTLFQDRDEANIILSKSLAQRCPAYHEVLEILRSIALEMIPR